MDWKAYLSGIVGAFTFFTFLWVTVAVIAIPEENYKKRELYRAQYEINCIQCHKINNRNWCSDKEKK